MTIEIERVPPLVAHVRALPGACYLCAEVAEALEVSPATLRRLAVRDPALGPSRADFGAIPVALYDSDAVERVATYLERHQETRGRPRLWDDTKRRRRRAAHSSVGYYRRRAQALLERGDLVRADRASRRAEALSSELREEHRLASVKVRCTR